MGAGAVFPRSSGRFESVTRQVVARCGFFSVPGFSDPLAGLSWLALSGRGERLDFSGVSAFFSKLGGSNPSEFVSINRARFFSREEKNRRIRKKFGPGGGTCLSPRKCLNFSCTRSKFCLHKLKILLAQAQNFCCTRCFFFAKNSIFFGRLHMRCASKVLIN